jgi:hypothetical protein
LRKTIVDLQCLYCVLFPFLVKERGVWEWEIWTAWSIRPCFVAKKVRKKKMLKTAAAICESEDAGSEAEAGIFSDWHGWAARGRF